MVPLVWYETLWRPRGVPAMGTKRDHHHSATREQLGWEGGCWCSPGWRGARSGPGPQTSGCQWWKYKGSPGKRVHLQERSQAWDTLRSGQKVLRGRGEELLTPLLCFLPTSLDVNDTNLVLRFGASEIIQRFISLLYRADKPRNEH